MILFFFLSTILYSQIGINIDTNKFVSLTKDELIYYMEKTITATSCDTLIRLKDNRIKELNAGISTRDANIELLEQKSDVQRSALLTMKINSERLKNDNESKSKKISFFKNGCIALIAIVLTETIIILVK